MPRNRVEFWRCIARGDRRRSLAFACALAWFAVAVISTPELAAQVASAPPAPREAPLYITNQPQIVVPFQVAAGGAGDGQPSKVNIYVSVDRGGQWDLFQTLKPNERSFRWAAKKDAEFWFATQVVDHLGRPNPPRVSLPQLRLIVDTQRPQLRIQGGIDGRGELALDVAAIDANLKPGDLQLEWQSPSDSRWFSLPLQASGRQVTGVVQGAVRQPLPEHVSAAVVRAEVADAAGNKAYFSRQFLRPRPQEIGEAPAELALRQRDPAAQRWQGEDLATRPPGEVVNPMVRVPATRSSERSLPGVAANSNLIQNPFAQASQGSPARPAASRPSEELLPPPQPAAPTGSNDAPSPGEPPRPNDLVAPNDTPTGPDFDSPTREQPPPAPPGIEYAPAPQPPPFDRAPPSTGVGPESLPPPRPGSASSEPLEPTTPQQPRLTNSRRFSLEYDVEAVGPEGIAEVELWGTNDAGRSWLKWGTDPDRESPFDVEVANETQYGFRIVVVGKNGLASNTPQAGDSADIWISIDTTRPQARLTGAIYGSGPQAGKLQLRWTAEDAHLGPRPITLLLAESPAGPYSTIAGGLPNTGEYWWEYDARSPRELYFRLEVRDAAGNISADQLSEPVKIEGLAPKARIRSVLPGASPPPPRTSFVSPLFR